MFKHFRTSLLTGFVLACILALLAWGFDRIKMTKWIGAVDLEIEFIVVAAESGQPVPGGRIEVRSEMGFYDGGQDPEVFELQTGASGTARRICRANTSTGTQSGLCFTNTYYVYLPEWRFQASVLGYQPTEWRELNRLEYRDHVQPLGLRKTRLVVPISLQKLASDAAQTVSFKSDLDKVVILAGDSPLATYYFKDKTTTRPFFAHVRGPGGIQVTRTHPPVTGKDLTDHATFHPGIWLAFGDLSGADSWRIRAPVKHEKFVQAPKGGAGRGTFIVSNLYLSADGKKVICRETCRYIILVRPAHFLLLWDSVFRSDEGDFAFGDQEEMGLGIRVATPLSVNQGGQILTSDGHKNERQVRGKQSAWCDYGGTIKGRRAGITLMPHPKNFRPCWYHARDYGFVAANPFGRKALTGGEASQVVVKKAQTLRLRFGVLLHAAPADKPVDFEAAYKDYLNQTADD